MPSYKQLCQRLEKEEDFNFEKELNSILNQIAELRQEQLGDVAHGGTHVMFYASGFLQGNKGETGIDDEDINDFMKSLHGVKEKSLTLILHTPGGHGEEGIVEYLHSKFDHIEVVVPTYAVSAGTMISLASDHLIMSKAAQLSPVDTQISMGAPSQSAWVIWEGYEGAKDEIRENKEMAELWVPLMGSMGPFLPLYAERTLLHGRDMLSKWLEARGLLNDKEEADNIADYFSGDLVDEYTEKYGRIHVHDQRIGMDVLRDMGLNVTKLEDSQKLQDAVMTAYWLMTLMFRTDQCLCKFIASNKNGICPTYSEIEEDVDEGEEE